MHKIHQVPLSYFPPLRLTSIANSVLSSVRVHCIGELLHTHSRGQFSVRFAGGIAAIMSELLCSAPGLGLVYRSKAARSQNRSSLRAFLEGISMCVRTTWPCTGRRAHITDSWPVSASCQHEGISDHVRANAYEAGSTGRCLFRLGSRSVLHLSGVITNLVTVALVGNL